MCQDEVHSQTKNSNLIGRKKKEYGLVYYTDKDLQFDFSPLIRSSSFTDGLLSENEGKFCRKDFLHSDLPLQKIGNMVGQEIVH